MIKTVWKGICQTLILIASLFLISMCVLQITFTQLAESLAKEENPAVLPQETADENGIVPQEGTETALSELMGNMSESELLSLREEVFVWAFDNPSFSGLFYIGMFLLIALFLIPDAFRRGGCGGESRAWTLINAGLYLGCGIPFLFFGYTETAIVIMNILYSATLTGESVIKLMKKHRPHHIAMRILLLLLLLLNLFLFPSFPLLILILIALRSFDQILRISFSQIRLDVLKKIIRKTYAPEILLGMLLLMVVFSILLSLLDEGIHSFWDALWFCFATVTTIGYGDVTAMSALSRILAVILGVYGIVVVALVTSIIVNFYNEMKTEKDEKQ